MALLDLRESVWLERGKYEQAEAMYQQSLVGSRAGVSVDVRPYPVSQYTVKHFTT